MSTPAPPRALGLPLDHESARQRAAQAAVLGDARSLRVLSRIAVTASGSSLLRIAEATGFTPDEVEAATAALVDVGLLDEDLRGAFHLTADAWVRFGRLLVANEPHRASTELGDLPELPEVAERIARDLSYRFSSVFSAETVARYVAESYALLAERARVTRFLPSLTARFAADRLGALATAQGLVLRGTPEVLFVCVQNSGRSQLAAAILRHLAGQRVHVRTAGSAPASVVDPLVVEVLDEVGVPIASEFPKPLTDEVVQAADFVVTMGCGDACPVYPGRRYMDWDIADPTGRPVDDVRRVRDEIWDRVVGLLAEIESPRPVA